jgi:hypothetical protein
VDSEVVDHLQDAIHRIRVIEETARREDSFDAALSATYCRWAVEDVLEEFLKQRYMND